MNEDPLNQKIEFVKGVGPHKASLLNKEIGIYTLYDMLHYFPFRSVSYTHLRAHET